MTMADKINDNDLIALQIKFPAAWLLLYNRQLMRESEANIPLAKLGQGDYEVEING